MIANFFFLMVFLICLPQIIQLLKLIGLLFLWLLVTIFGTKKEEGTKAPELDSLKKDLSV